MKTKAFGKINLLDILISLVWLLNGLVCKVLNFVPRHEAIVGRILGNEYSRLFVVMIGVAEILMSVWVLSRYKSKVCAWTQIVVVGTMNIIEFTLASDLLLWGRYNIIFAFLFMIVIFMNEYMVHKK